ncbi:hypothetical protein ACROYT_G034931 [Oculina patagonica]
MNQRRLNFDATRKTIRHAPQVEILADTLYIEGPVKLHGIRNLKLYTRRIVASPGSQIDVSAPNWDQVYKTRVIAGTDGEDGYDGKDGPKVEINADVVEGSLDIIANGGNGHKGQDGGDGAKGVNRPQPPPDLPSSICTDQGLIRKGDWCRGRYNGKRGYNGSNGKNGGNAGKSGKGGKSGNIKFRWNKIKGTVALKSCGGKGAQPAKNGKGGKGGRGSEGGKGRKCGQGEIGDLFGCYDDGPWVRAPSGTDGKDGQPGKGPTTKGTDGAVRKSMIQPGKMGKFTKKSYPMQLLRVMKRQAEDLLLGDASNEQGKAALTFLKNVLKEKSGTRVGVLKKEVTRKLGFLGKKGFDIFGRNKLFAPRMRWETLKNVAEKLKNTAKEYETAFNGIKSSVESKENFQQLARKMAKVGRKQVNAEKRRLIEAKNIADSEKRLYVKSIQQLETQMTDIIKQVETILPETLEAAKFHKGDFLAILQGVTGFVSAAASKDPFAFIDSAIGIADSQQGKECLKSLSSYTSSIKKWLTFGKNYSPRKDSSDLDFDQLDVDSVPDVMQVNLELNKEALTEELFCLLEVAARPQDVAGFKRHLESFFIAGAARIDLIGKVMDLDNEIGGYNFDIPLLDDTEKTLRDIGRPGAAPITKNLQLGFMDNLLSTYRELEQSFMINVYELYKALRFRTLWEGNDPLANFQRVASESARGTGQLNGIIQLTDVLRNMEQTETKAVQCFTNNVYTTNINKWSFDKTKNPDIFAGIAKGYTRFSLKIDQSCSSCYNIRLLKLYVELTGPSKQPTDVGKDIHLKIRHLSASYFRAGDDTIKQYRQPIGSYRKIKFDRFSISDEQKCRLKTEDREESLFCVKKDDQRWQPMCSNPLSKCVRDRLLGDEECKSPFGTYELQIPVDKKLSCTGDGIKDTNCKDLDLTKFTKMNVWAYFFYWSGSYPKGPDDASCRSPSEKRTQTTSCTM